MSNKGNNIPIEKAINIKSTDFLNIDGWVPLKVRYGLHYLAEKSVYLLWNVIGTNHTFNIDIRTVNELHGSNYEEHFTVILTKFRKDFMVWNSMGFPEDWMQRYYEEYNRFII